LFSNKVREQELKKLEGGFGERGLFVLCMEGQETRMKNSKISSFRMIAGSRFKNEKTADGLARQIVALQAEMKDARFGVVEDSVCRVLEDVATAVGRHVAQCQKNKPPSGAVKGLCAAFCSFLAFLGKRASRFESVSWDQGSVVAVSSCLSRILALTSAVSVSEVLRAFAVTLHERTHMLSKDMQDSLVATCCNHAVLVAALAPQASAAAAAAADEEDEKDGSAAGAAVVAPVQQAWQGADDTVSALLCLSAMARAKRKSHFVETHFKSVGALALNLFGVLSPAVARGGTGVSVLIAVLQLLESLVISSGPLFPAEFGSKLHALVSSLSLLVSSSGMRSEEGSLSGVSSTDGCSSMSESGAARFSLVDRLRVHVMLVLSALCTSCYKQVSNDMLLLLPYCNVAHQAAFFETSRSSLYFFVLHDPNYRVRMHALSLLLALLKPSRGFFSVAMDQQAAKQTSFISLSQKLALTLRDLHAVIEIGLGKEDDPGNRALLMKLVPALASVTPYDRLRKDDETDLLFPVLNRVLTVNASVLTADQLGCVLGVVKVKSELSAVARWIERFDLVLKLVAMCLLSEPVTLAEHCLIDLCTRYANVAVGPLVGKGLLGQLLTRRMLSADVMHVAIALAASVSAIGESEVLSFWTCVLNAVLPRQAHFFAISTPPSVSAAFLTLLSSIAPIAWDQQPSRVQLIVVSSVSGCAASSEPEVRLAAVRGMGQLLMLESLVRENGRFLMDANVVIEDVLKGKLDEGSEDLRGWAFWALGNLAQALDVVLSQTDAEAEQRVDALALLHGAVRWALEELAVATASGNEKVLCSCFRVVGKAAKQLDSSLISSMATDLISAFEMGLGTKQKAKVRWNVCSAIVLALDGTFGKCYDTDASLWKSKIRSILVEIVITSSNYKARR
jgi:hypothetical protein